ncbi:hypothetical protein [Nostoc sp.]
MILDRPASSGRISAGRVLAPQRECGSRSTRHSRPNGYKVRSLET